MKVAARIVEELATANGPSCTAKAIYTVTMFKQPPSIDSLASEAGINPKHVARHCRELERLGWLRLVEDGRKLRPEAVLPREAESKLVSEVRRLIGVTAYKGESATKIFVEWVVAPTVRLVYNARPDFLRNSKTDRNLEYDIFAPDFAWATEYHGDQHFGPTSRYPGEKAFIERHQRDLLKLRLSKLNKVRLSIITNQTLTLEGILEVIPRDVPLRPFDPKGPFIQVLEQIGREVAGSQGRDTE